jgi:hypothetical protein
LPDFKVSWDKGREAEIQHVDRKDPDSAKSLGTEERMCALHLDMVNDKDSMPLRSDQKEI